MPEYLRKKNRMDKAQLITLLYLLKTETPQLETLSDYIKQFDVIEENVRSLMENIENS